MNRARLLGVVVMAVGVGLALAGLLSPLGATFAGPALGSPPLTTTPVVCTISFTDVPPTHPFYPYIQCLACNGVVSGYADGTFRPGAEVTRGQLAKILSQAAGFADPIPTTQQTFEDVPPTQPFWVWIERLAGRGILSGYGCGGAGEPCVPPGNRAYLRPGASATRGQIAKITALAAGLPDPVPTTQQTFVDVPSANPFWLWIEQLAGRGIVSGYTCGGAGEPCVPPGNRPYFRWGANTTRGQMSKVAALTFFVTCLMPPPVLTPTPPLLTATPTAAASPPLLTSTPTAAASPPTLTGTSTRLAAPSATRTPAATATGTPNCCTAVSASVGATCVPELPPLYHEITYVAAVLNNCAVPFTATYEVFLEVATTQCSSWQNYGPVSGIWTSVFQPGTTTLTDTVPAAFPNIYNYYRIRVNLRLANNCGVFDFYSPCYAICPSITPTPTRTVSPTPTVTGTPPTVTPTLTPGCCQTLNANLLGFCNVVSPPGVEIEGAADVLNNCTGALSIQYTFYVERSPDLINWDTQDQHAPVYTVLPPGTSTLDDRFTHEVFPPFYPYWRVRLRLELLNGCAVYDFFSAPDFICTP